MAHISQQMQLKGYFCDMQGIQSDYHLQWNAWWSTAMDAGSLRVVYNNNIRTTMISVC